MQPEAHGKKHHAQPQQPATQANDPQKAAPAGKAGQTGAQIPQRLTLKERRHAIGAILESRFSVSAFDEVRRANPRYWASPRNDMARGIYGQAMRAKQELAAASDAQLAAELLEIRVAPPPGR